jgi:hypothetical protein
MRNFYFTFLIFSFFSLSTYAQDTLQTKTKPKIKVSWSFRGQASLTSDFSENLFAHFGGPGVTLSANKVGLFVGMFPSVRFYQQGKISPLLGAGGQIIIKKLVFPIVFYNINSQADPKIVLTYGIGYRF